MKWRDIYGDIPIMVSAWTAFTKIMAKSHALYNEFESKPF